MAGDYTVNTHLTLDNNILSLELSASFPCKVILDGLQAQDQAIIRFILTNNHKLLLQTRNYPCFFHMFYSEDACLLQRQVR